MRVTIGVHVHDALGLEETLQAIAASTPEPHEIVLLEEHRGAPAALNALARRGDASTLVFLECGVLVSEGWLGRLLGALDADPRRGLAGPSTNSTWNEQRVSSREAALLFGDEVRSLAPLHTLGDFCFAIRREVLDAIGGADEAYGRGPFWEMDLNVRAARAGWDAVWVCGAYVHRTRRITDESLFDTNRRLYQDRFCGARLRGEKHDYRQHCRGDECPNFAPAVALKPAAPLVSCIMPTRNRRSHVPAAIRLFLRQEYERRELVILDDGDDPVRDLVPDDPRIRYVRTNPMTIGAKRNRGCEEARGELVAHWDDDDWYPTWRLAEQVRALLADGADVCGSSALYFHDATHGRAWEYRYPPNTGWMAGSTLLYRKAFWQRNVFPETSNGEDSAFVCANVPKVLRDLADPRLCVAGLHERNTATKPEGSLWQHCPVSVVIELKGMPKRPLVSCVMPTYNRRRFIPRALRAFEQQTWPERELLVIDDGEDSIEDLCRGTAGVRYFHLSVHASVGAKRNFGAQQASGELIAHWDDDDWYAPSRLETQIAPILAGEADLTGFGDTLVLESGNARFWELRPELHERAFLADVAAGTLVYRRAILGDDVVYPNINVGEDASFLDRARAAGFRLRRLPNDGAFVYVRHSANTWHAFTPGRYIDPGGWRETTKPAGMSEETLALLLERGALQLNPSTG